MNRGLAADAAAKILAVGEHHAALAHNLGEQAAESFRACDLCEPRRNPASGADPAIAGEMNNAYNLFRRAAGAWSVAAGSALILGHGERARTAREAALGASQAATDMHILIEERRLREEALR